MLNINFALFDGCWQFK